MDDVLRQVQSRPRLAMTRHAEGEGSSRAVKRQEDEWEKVVRSCVGQLVAEGFDGKRIGDSNDETYQSLHSMIQLPQKGF